MTVNCLFCNQDVSNDHQTAQIDIRPEEELYVCLRCGLISLDPMTRSHIWKIEPSHEGLISISITLRNEWERGHRGLRKGCYRPNLKLEDLQKIIQQFKPLAPLEMMDNALVVCDRITPYIGQFIPIDPSTDYPYFYCKNAEELIGLFGLLDDEDLIKGTVPTHPTTNTVLTPKGYQRLREIQKPNQESNQCFVAMWFADEMKNAFDDAIMPAIQYVEPGGTESRFKAVKIDNVEHANDINDEIIAQIRRSRFMVCDLTGYRGGVYFEAGFAYGLGLPVIYTCRKDWTKPETLRDTPDGKPIELLYDENGQAIRVGKEGVHFDLNHRNRIEWDPSDLEDFRIKLERRIKAVIY